MEEKKLSREEVEHSIRGSLSSHITNDESTDFHVDEADIIELTAEMEIKGNESEFSDADVFCDAPPNPFANLETPAIGENNIEESVEKIATQIIQKWLDENLSNIVEKAVHEEFEHINKQKMVIAIDGPAASGKGTLARRLATHLGLKYLDTGSLYRAVAAKVLTTGEDPENIVTNLKETDLHVANLRDEEVGNLASEISTIPAVRENLLHWQRNFAEQGAVLDGRDIGTVVCPEADIKFYIYASTEVRAERRFAELSKNNPHLTLEHVQHDLEERDKRDMQRTICPLLPAEDAIRIDTSDVNAEEVFEKAIGYIE